LQDLREEEFVFFVGWDGEAHIGVELIGGDCTFGGCAVLEDNRGGVALKGGRRGGGREEDE